MGNQTTVIIPTIGTRGDVQPHIALGLPTASVTPCGAQRIGQHL